MFHGGGLGVSKAPGHRAEGSSLLLPFLLSPQRPLAPGSSMPGPFVPSDWGVLAPDLFSPVALEQRVCPGCLPASLCRGSELRWRGSGCRPPPPRLLLPLHAIRAPQGDTFRWLLW